MTETGDTNQKPSWISAENRRDKRFDNTYRVEVPGSGTYLVRAEDEREAAEYVVGELGFPRVDQTAAECRVERVRPESRRPGSAVGRLIPRADFDDPLPPDLLAAFEGEDSDGVPLAAPTLPAPPLEAEKVLQALRWELCAPAEVVDLVPEDLPEVVTVETVEGGLRLRFAGDQYFRLTITREEIVDE